MSEPGAGMLRILLERASCRSFTDEPIPDEVMDQILQTGVHAATGGNLQPWSVIRFEDAAVRQELAEMCWQQFMAQAPVHLLICIDWRRVERWCELEVAPFVAPHAFRHFWIAIQDAVIAAQSMCTAADALGLGSVYIGSVLEHIPACRRMFDLPRGVLPVVLLCLGYPKARPEPRRKLGIPVVVHRERYGELRDQELRAAFDEKHPPGMEITDERLETIRQTCQEAHGEAFARRCLERISERGLIHPAQVYFGLHYRASEMPLGNPELLDAIRACGFDFFEPWEPEER